MARWLSMLSHSLRRLPQAKPWLWHGIGFVTTVGTALLVFYGMQPVSQYLPPPTGEGEPAFQPDMISAQALRATQGKPGAPVIIDVRSPEAYRQGHLPGALSVPGYELPQHLEKVPLGVKLALYCS